MVNCDRSKSVKNAKEAPCNLSQAKPTPKELNLKSLAMQAGLEFSGCPTPADSHFSGGSSVKLAHTFRHFQPFKALVLGDFMLDSYTTGRVKRISPEAPVPVMEVIKQESRPGGAGNVVLSLTTLGAQVFAVGRIGKDGEGMALKKLLEKADTCCLIEEPNYKTPVKNRLIADSQQLIRVDFETIVPLSADLESQVVEELKRLIPQVQVVAISDYGKGFLTNRLLEATIQIAKSINIPVIVDPKGSDFTKYRGASVIKPNLSEAYAAAKCPNHFPIDRVAGELAHLTDILLITRSEAGISVFDAKGTRSDFPVRSKEVKDVTGAGDTVLATLCLGLANGLDIYLSAQLANIAAGLAIERLGCVQISLSEIAQRLLEYDSDTKIFDESHTYALHQVLQGKQYSLLVLEKDQAMTNALFSTIRKLSSNRELIIYVRDSHPNDEFIHLLSSLHEVSYIILQTEGLKHLCQAIHPYEVFVFDQTAAVRCDQAIELLDSLIRKQLLKDSRASAGNC